MKTAQRRFLKQIPRFLLAFLLYTSFAMAQSPARILIKFRSGTQALAAARAGVSRALTESRTLTAPSFAGTRVASTLSAAGVVRLRAVKPDAGLQPLPAGIERLFIADLGPGASVAEAVRSLARNPDIEYVEPDAVARITGSAAPVIPNDQYFSSQWALQNAAQTINGITGTAGADIDATDAWNISTGSSSIVLAVLDTGVALSHPEFQGRLVQGANFVASSTSYADDNGHGTAVASIAAATAGNNQLMAGVDWKCQIMPVKVIDSQGNAQYSDVISGIQYAADHGANVINLSLAGTAPSSALQNAVTYANSKGAIVVASLGNDNKDTTTTPYYPAAYSNVIAVGATNSKDQRAVPFNCGTGEAGSNYGSSIGFVAPGDLLIALSYTNQTAVTAWCGTSVAAAVVSGTVTLMLAVNPALTFDQVYSVLKTSAHDQVGLASEDTQGWDKYYGWGRIDAYRSLVAAQGTGLFSQVAVGGGYTTVFTFLNTGSTAVNATLTLTRGDNGSPLIAIITDPSSTSTQTSSYPFTVPAGGAQYLTATSSSSQASTGWAKTTPSSGLLGGVATFSYAPSGAIQTVAGVLSSSTVSAATIPVDDDVSQQRETGYAVANPGTSPITIRVVTVNADGSTGTTLTTISLAAGQQTAGFFYLDPVLSSQQSTWKFRGSVVLIGQNGAVFSAVALVLNQKLLAAIPVIPSKAPNIK
jgi:subtilisin family serine protease